MVSLDRRGIVRADHSGETTEEELDTGHSIAAVRGWKEIPKNPRSS
jgi:hypothetical protein